ncbi:MAG: Biopolymer transport protein ExbD [Bryobacteraceae bacterium]|nr:Biopolymer transport protein ExbD [Bryobacteraceae bacterium]MCC6340832.1 biopolymer transporter ExbD [Bryobacterales bacterium]
MGMSVGGPEGGPKSDINMTPLIDVLLVLLIIFMVITPLTPKGLETLVPQPPPPNAPPPPPGQDRTVVIIINKDRSMMLNTEPINEDRLGSRLEEVFKTRAERVVFVKGDPDLEFRDVAKAIDIAKGAGIDKVGLMTPKIEAGQ